MTGIRRRPALSGAVPSPAALLTVEISTPRVDTVVVAGWGEIDDATAPRLRAELALALRSAPRLLVVDLAEVWFLGSAGLNALTIIRDTLPGGTRLRIVASGRATRRVFELAGLGEVFDLYPTRDAALSG
ncbi:STAS domain-containing protein [Amycolatopsis anabasis]|uniref:STAS domain-containing protein n=1 Tax=Amycolatopsis anabasis TaxID=1840409 RepID=UPI00131A6FC5|nr:STAS domain-containing protein [Amycolatopsis anabasis]